MSNFYNDNKDLKFHYESSNDAKIGDFERTEFRG